MHFILQPSQESSILVMPRAFDDYYIEDCGVILASEVTQRKIDNNDHRLSAQEFMVSQWRLT